MSVIRFGRNIIVPAHPVYAMLGIPTDAAPSTGERGGVKGDQGGTNMTER